MYKEAMQAGGRVAGIIAVSWIVALGAVAVAGEGSTVEKDQIVYMPATIQFSYALPQNFPSALLGPDATCEAWVCDWTYRACDPLQVVSIKKRRSIVTVDLPVGEKHEEVGIKRVGVPFGLSGEWERALRSDRDSCLKLVGAVQVAETETERPKGYHLGFMKGWEVFQGEFTVRVVEQQ